MTWRLIGDGNRLDTCGSPWARHQFFDNTVVWGPQQCTRRECPRCCDHRYIIDAADKIVREIFAWIAYKIAHGGLFDQAGRSLKIYRYRYSRCKNDNNLGMVRKQSIRRLRGAGLNCGNTVLHPYRGSHSKKASPKECREAMDRTKLSIHTHGYGLGFWTKKAEKGQGSEYYNIYKVADVREFVDPDRQIEIRNSMLKKIQYDLGHAGYYGKGQCTSTWGDRVSKKDAEGFRPLRPNVVFKHPDTTMDGEDIWELKRTPDPEAWVELEEGARKLRQDNPDIYETNDYSEVLPDGGQMFDQGIYRWWSMSSIDQDEHHENWWIWRSSIANTIFVLISEGD